MTQIAEGRSLADLLRDLAGGTSTLLRQELSLARAETQDKLHQIIAVLVAMLGGALLAFAGLIILLDALVYGLVEAGMERWLAALVVGGVVALVGLLVAWKAQSELSATRLAPERSAASFRKDVDMLREQVS
jgi:Putative Actinobacterial Holin-X, holin superfamily III